MRTGRDLARFYVRVLAATVLLSAAFAGLARHLIVNCTESMPLGLYWLARGQPPHRRDLVAFPIPDNVRELVHDRRYLPDGALLLKQVVALPGDRVCTDEGVLTINDAPFGAIAVHDRAWSASAPPDRLRHRPRRSAVRRIALRPELRLAKLWPHPPVRPPRNGDAPMDLPATILACSLYFDDDLVRAIAESTSHANPYFVTDVGIELTAVIPPDPRTLDDALARAHDMPRWPSRQSFPERTRWPHLEDRVLRRRMGKNGGTSALGTNKEAAHGVTSDLRTTVARALGPIVARGVGFDLRARHRCAPCPAAGHLHGRRSAASARVGHSPGAWRGRCRVRFPPAAVRGGRGPRCAPGRPAETKARCRCARAHRGRTCRGGACWGDAERRSREGKLPESLGRGQPIASRRARP
jgi:type IV secretory pathway protease TraF